MRRLALLLASTMLALAMTCCNTLDFLVLGGELLECERDSECPPNFYCVDACWLSDCSMIGDCHLKGKACQNYTCNWTVEDAGLGGG